MYNDQLFATSSASGKGGNYLPPSVNTIVSQSMVSFIVEVGLKETPLYRALHATRNSYFDLDSYVNEDETSLFWSLKQASQTLFTYLSAFIKAPVVSHEYALDIGLVHLLQFALLFKRVSHHPTIKWIAPQFKTLILQIQSLSTYMKLNQLASDLADLSDLLDQPNQNNLLQLSSVLQEAMKRNRNLGHYWELNKLQHEKLIEYFKLNSLLHECLKQAVVSDRSSILNTFLVVAPYKKALEPIAS